MNIKTWDMKIITWLRRTYLPVARIAIFIIYFYFGILKLLGDSPATPLAHALVNKTLGAANFDIAFTMLAVFECIVGILFLFPKLTRIVIPLLLIHMIIVCSPLFLVSDQAFTRPFVPTLEGQYIVKNVAIIALALGVAAQTPPLRNKKTGKS
ncbi:MAG TPA: hypothetical protein VD706_03355 [Candidatus Saccharimonadales bacterium]|nr:hypothetical protein [Candidatus Saccharimonadales bacterium]